MKIKKMHEKIVKLSKQVERLELARNDGGELLITIKKAKILHLIDRIYAKQDNKFGKEWSKGFLELRKLPDGNEKTTSVQAPCYHCNNLGTLNIYPNQQVFSCPYCTSAYILTLHLQCPSCNNNTLTDYYFDEYIMSHLRLVRHWTQCPCGYRTSTTYYYYWV